MVQSFHSNAVVSAQPRHGVFSLVDNRLLAHLQWRGGLLLDAGSAGFVKYTNFSMPEKTWSPGREIDGIKVALPRRRAKLQVPLTSSQAAGTTTIAMRLHAPKSTRLKVSINGKQSSGAGKDKIWLRKGWQIVQVPVARGRFKSGENRLRLKFGRGKRPAVQWISIGEDPGDIDRLMPIYKSPDDSPGDDSSGLILPHNSGLAYHLKIPASARLTAKVRDPACEVAVTASVHEGDSVTGVLRGASSHVDLSPLSGRIARVELTARACPLARIDHAALTVPGKAPSDTAVSRRKGKPPKYVVLWVMDTLRADYIKLFNPRAVAEVPNMQRLAQKGAVFLRTYSQGPESQAGHGALFTGLYSIQHGLGWLRRHRLARDLAVLGPVMKDLGFYNVGVTANGYATKKRGIGRGFDVYRNLMRDGYGNRMAGRVPSSVLFDVAIAALEKKTNTPFFLFLGTIDTHKPWIAYEPWISKYDKTPYRGIFKDEVTGGMLKMVPGHRGCVWEPDPRDVQRIRAIYTSDISYQDYYVGKMLDKLDEWGIADETMIIITADHGEELFEHGRCGHGYALREPMVHIPLLIHYPPLIPATVVEEGTEQVDVFPTILDALGQDRPDHIAGQSLIPLAHGVGRGYPRPTFSSLPTDRFAMRLDRWKVRVIRQSKPWMLYDLPSDPLEQNDLAAKRPLEFRFVGDPMAVFLANRRSWSKSRWGVASNMTAQAARELHR
ncbi:MAG: sulfatase [Proteobacteria bacterium]|nr:sulfatase [Pseudomonadota bacterium]